MPKILSSFIPGGQNLLQIVSKEHFDDLSEVYDEAYSKTYGKYRISCKSFYLFPSCYKKRTLLFLRTNNRGIYPDAAAKAVGFLYILGAGDFISVFEGTSSGFQPILLFKTL